MRIFHLVPNLNFGGLQKIVRLLAVSQVQSGHSVTIGCWTNVSNHREAEDELKQAGVNIVYLRRNSDGGLSFGRMSLFNKLKAQMGARKTDILHVHNPFSYYLYGALAARAAGGTVIVNTLHATAMFSNKTSGKKYKAIFWAAAMLSDGVVSVASDMDTVLRTEFVLPRNKLFLVENGIDVGPFLALTPRSSRGEIVFGTAGRMSSEKNHRVLIDAFALLRRDHVDIRLRLLGGGNLEPALRSQVRDLGLSGAVEFCGFTHDVPAFLSGVDIYVSPSNFEAFGLGVLEAIASGAPVVATAVGGVPEIVQNTDGGWLCPPNDADALRAAMELALLSSDRRDRGERARRLVTERYSAERMTRDYEQLYRKLVH
jgi:glycosyltransferase involved in cell wall biosynthesis